MELAHDSHGHMGGKKVKEMLKGKVVWPGICEDIRKWCESCEQCQRESRLAVRKVPMKEVPVITEPFEKVAIDLVGPFDRTSQGYRMILTIMDLATRWPEALPLKHAHARAIAEGLCEVFCRHRLLGQLLLD